VTAGSTTYPDFFLAASQEEASLAKLAWNLVAAKQQVEASNDHDEQSSASTTLAVPPYLGDVSAMFSIPFDYQRSAGNLVELNAEWNRPPIRYYGPCQPCS
jgi:hypothetical protein